MTDFAPQRVGHPFRSVITVAELLGRTGTTPDEGPSIPSMRTAVSVSALVRREGYTCNLDEARNVEPRADRTFTGLETPQRRLAASAGAVIAVSSLAGAAIMLSNATPGATSAGALDGGYPGKGVLDQPAGFPGSDGAALHGVLPLGMNPVAFPSPLGPAGLPSAALSRGVLPSIPLARTLSLIHI